MCVAIKKKLNKDCEGISNLGTWPFYYTLYLCEKESIYLATIKRKIPAQNQPPNPYSMRPHDFKSYLQSVIRPLSEDDFNTQVCAGFSSG